LDSILEGLPQEYDFIVALVKSKVDSITIEEVEEITSLNSCSRTVSTKLWKEIIKFYFFTHISQNSFIPSAQVLDQ